MSESNSSLSINSDSLNHIAQQQKQLNQQEFDQAKAFFQNNLTSYYWKNKKHPGHILQEHEVFFYGHEYIRTPDGKIYQIWNRENKHEVAYYQEKYGIFGHGAHSHVEYAVDEFGEVFIAKFVAKYDRQENKLCELARTLVSPPVGIEVGIESSFIDGDGVEFVSIMRFLGETLNQSFEATIAENRDAFESNPESLLDFMYDLGIKTCLAVHQYNNGEALSGQSCALLDTKPDNILVDPFKNVHVVDLGSVSMKLAEVCREITGSPAALLPIQEGVEVTNLQQNMVGLLRTLFLPKSFWGANRKGEKFSYDREPGDFAIFDEALLEQLGLQESLAKLAWLLSINGDDIADVVDSLPLSALDLAFLLMRSKTKTLEELQQEAEEDCAKSDLLKQALINISLVNVEITPELEEQVNNSISLQSALVALGKFEKTQTENYLTSENVLMLLKNTEQCLKEINSLMLSATRFFSQNPLSARTEDSLNNNEKPLSLIQQAILTLVESDVTDEMVWRKVLDNDVVLQLAFLLLRQPGFNIIAKDNNIQRLANSAQPIEEAASILKEIEPADRAGRLPVYIDNLIYLNIPASEQTIWREVAQNNCVIQNVVVALGKSIKPDMFVSVINKLVADEALQAIVDELILNQPCMLTDKFLYRLVSKSESFKKAVNTLGKFNLLWLDKSNIVQVCKSSNPIATVEDCIVRLTQVNARYSQDEFSLNASIVKKLLVEDIGHAGAAKWFVRLSFFNRSKERLSGIYESNFVRACLDNRFQSSGSYEDAKTIILQFLRIVIKPSGLFSARRRLDVRIIELDIYLHMARQLFAITDVDINNAITNPKPGNGVSTVWKLKSGRCQPPNFGGEDPSQRVNVPPKTLAMV